MTQGTAPAGPGTAAAPGLACIVASAGRPADLAHLLRALAEQTRRPDVVVVSVPTPTDAPAWDDPSLSVDVVLGPRGLAAQRNAALRRTGSCALVMFFDDDFLPHPTYLARLAAAMEANPDLLAADGHVMFDGAAGPGLDWQQAEALIRASGDNPDAAVRYDQPDGLYGCNMGIRRRIFDRLSFDEMLPLYSWLEDYDMSRRLMREGRIGRVMAARGIHLGVKRGRTSGLRLGYSQIANPLYLARKGSMPFGTCLLHLLRRPAGNVWGLVRRDRHVDRLGRLRGNVLGLFDALRGRCRPAHVLTLR